MPCFINCINNQIKSSTWSEDNSILWKWWYACVFYCILILWKYMSVHLSKSVTFFDNVLNNKQAPSLNRILSSACAVMAADRCQQDIWWASNWTWILRATVFQFHWSASSRSQNTDTDLRPAAGIRTRFLLTMQLILGSTCHGGVCVWTLPPPSPLLMRTIHHFEQGKSEWETFKTH